MCVLQRGKWRARAESCAGEWWEGGGGARGGEQGVGGRNARAHLRLLPLDAPLDHMAGSRLLKGGLDKLAAPAEYTKVSRAEATRARAECTVHLVRRRDVPPAQRYQAGQEFWHAVVDDAASALKNKKIIIVVDMFCSVGDTAHGFYEMLKNRGGLAAKPLCFFFGTDFREHFYAVARTRVLAKGKADFNAEALFVEGFAPLPAVDPSWAGRVPDLPTFVSNIQRDMRVLTVSRSGQLIIPKDSDIGVMLTPELKGHLDQWRTQWPDAAPAETRREQSKTDPVVAAAPPQHTIFKTEADLRQYYEIIKVVPCGTRQMVVVNVKGAEFDMHGDGHSVWVRNPAASAPLVLEKDTDMCGCGKATLVVEGTERFDPYAPCTIRWGFHRVASNEGVISADSASIFYQMKGATALSMTTVAAALKDQNAFPHGSMYGFSTTVDSKKRCQLKPQAALRPRGTRHGRERERERERGRERGR